MSDSHDNCPIDSAEVIRKYFLEHRAKIIDIAAFLDRVDRADGDGASDYRIQAMREAIRIAGDLQPERARRILELLSDPSVEPIEQAPMKGAMGAHDPESDEGG